MSKYDLEERTFMFSQNIILLIKTIPPSFYNRNVIEQILKSSTSIGANYSEANGASSKRDFRNKCYICKKEAKETKYWLRLLAVVEPSFKNEIFSLLNESNQLTLIFGKIASNIQKSESFKIKNFKL